MRLLHVPPPFWLGLSYFTITLAAETCIVWAITSNARHVSIRQHTSAYVSIRQHTSACVRIRQAYYKVTTGMSAARNRAVPLLKLSLNSSGDSGAFRIQHTSAYVSIRQHTSAYVSIRQHASAYVSIRQHTSACVIEQPRY